nr:hypothetical protein Itr_chr04CG22520 [Ipomoea trifida]
MAANPKRTSKVTHTNAPDTNAIVPLTLLTMRPRGVPACIEECNMMQLPPLSTAEFLRVNVLCIINSTCNMITPLTSVTP